MIRASLGAAKPRRPLTRTPMKRGRVRVGRASAARRKAGGARVKGRPALSVTGWKALVLDLIQRCGSRCEVPWCRHLAALDPHHVIPTSLGGADDACNVLMVCRSCHERFDAAYVKGKHVAESVGHERFRIALEYRDGKGAPLKAGSHQEHYTRPDGAF